MNKVLITGGNGQLAKTIEKLFPQGVFVSRTDFDILNRDQMHRFLNQHSFSILINCAAYTNVERAEESEQIASLVNIDGVKNLLEMAEIYNLGMIHISTDFVFDGEKSHPYKESDIPHALNNYGRSKLMGERLILDRNLPRTAIIRTSWLYGGQNDFVSKILFLARDKQLLKVVADQIGCPTSAKDLAYAVLALVDKIHLLSSAELFHFSNLGFGTWHEFAKEFLEHFRWEGKLESTTSKEFGSKVNRPKYSVLNSDKISNFLNLNIREWRLALKEHLDEDY